MVRSFTIERPATKSQFPKWDLALVLKYLLRAPFKPLCAASLLNLTKKTVFLLAFAPGARRSELDSLDLDETLMPDGGRSVYLRPTKDFIAKNHNTGRTDLMDSKLPDLTHSQGLT